MSNIDIIRAWKDEEYRNSLSEEERAQIPNNPAGLIDLTDAETEAITGGVTRQIVGGQLVAFSSTVNGETCCSSHTAYTSKGNCCTIIAILPSNN
ncbi:MAG: mersacidin/lichenicidin family type 2 lantibiotic [Coleofasciculaceae cyanobacterium]